MLANSGVSQVQWENGGLAVEFISVLDSGGRSTQIFIDVLIAQSKNT